MKLSVLSILLLFNLALAWPGSLIQHSDSPGSYRDSLLLQISTTPIIGKLTSAQAEAGYQAVCDTFNDDNSIVLSEMTIVIQNAISVQNQFRSIEVQLHLIDSENLSAQKFGPGWTALSQDWANILWASSDTALDTSAFCQELVEQIMPLVANHTGTLIPPALGVEALSMYIQQVDGFKSKAEATAQSFSDLQTALTTFAVTFANFSGVDDNTTIDDLNTDIAQLKSAISALDDAINGAGVLLGFTIFGEGILMALLPVLTPLLIAAGVAVVGGETATFGALVAERESAANDLAADETQLQSLQAQESAIAQAKTTMNTVRNVTIPAMIDSLNAFNTIWDGIVSDCQTSIDYLNQTISNEETIPMLLWTSIERVPCLYDQLIPALNDYASGINASGIPGPTDGPLSQFKAMSKDDFHTKIESIVKHVQIKAASLLEI